jgi:hypothetical protein
LQRRLAGAIAQSRFDRTDIARFIGRFLTEPKPDVVFTAPARVSRAGFVRRGERDGLRLDRRTQLLYDNERYYLNGDDAPFPDAHRLALQRLADHRMLSRSEFDSTVARYARSALRLASHGYLGHPLTRRFRRPPGLPREERLDSVDELIRAQDDVIALARRHIKVFDVDLSWGGWNAATRCRRAGLVHAADSGARCRSSFTTRTGSRLPARV